MNLMLAFIYAGLISVLGQEAMVDSRMRGLIRKEKPAQTPSERYLDAKVLKTVDTL